MEKIQLEKREEENLATQSNNQEVVDVEHQPERERAV